MFHHIRVPVLDFDDLKGTYLHACLCPKQCSSTFFLSSIPLISSQRCISLTILLQIHLLNLVSCALLSILGIYRMALYPHILGRLCLLVILIHNITFPLTYNQKSSQVLALEFNSVGGMLYYLPLVRNQRSHLHLRCKSITYKIISIGI